MAKLLPKKKKANGRPKKGSRVGRPSVMTEEKLEQLRQAFLWGATDEEACIYAMVHPATYYLYCKANPGFYEQIKKCKQDPILRAKKTVSENIKELGTAKWYLEKKLKNEFGDVKKIELETNDKFDKMSAEEKANFLIANANAT